MDKSLSKFWWLWLPLLIMTLQVCLEVFGTGEQKIFFLKEGSVQENFQAFIMAVSAIMAIRLVLFVENKWLKIWFAVAALCAFFVSGEELSWGQWIFEWDTPTHWAELNDQNETNLHNTSSWFDQKPFIILSVGVLIGGIIIPLLQKWAPHKLPAKFASVYADYRVMPVALIALALKLSDVYTKFSGHELFWRVNEILEMFLYGFVFIYLLVMKDKYLADPELIKDNKKAAS